MSDRIQQAIDRRGNRFDRAIARRGGASGKSNWQHLKDGATQAANVAGDVIRSAETGARQGIAAAADIPGAALNFAGGKAVDAMEAVGLPEQVGQGARDFFAGGPWGDGTTNYQAVNDLTGGSLDYEPQTTAGEYAQTVGQFLPFSAANPLAFGVLPGIASEAAGQATEGMTIPESFPLIGGAPAETPARIAAALMAPSAANAVSRVVTPNPTTPRRVQAAQRLADEGIDTTAGQRTNNRRLRFREEQSTRTGDIMENQNSQFTAAALKRIQARDPQTLGPAALATDDVIKQAGDDIGALFNESTKNITLNPSRDTASRMMQAATDYAELTNKSQVAPIIQNQFSKVVDRLMSGQPITGREYQKWRSQLSKATTGADGQLREAARRFIDALDDAAEGSFNDPTDLADFAKARTQWRDFLAIRDASVMSGVDAADGVISPQQLRGKLTSGSGRSSYATGERDLASLTRDANSIMTRPPSSGTAERNIAQQLMAGSGTGGVAGGITYGLTRDPQLAASAALAVSSAPAAANGVIGSPVGQAYLRNQLMQGRVPAATPEVSTAAITQYLLQRQAEKETK